MSETSGVEVIMSGMEVGVHKGCGGIVLLTDKFTYYCLSCLKEQAGSRKPSWVCANWRKQKRNT